ncbi:1-acyl-sn-glycerol-3-phosphate acyltransferase [Oleiagrimonas sp.]|jgi:1-acyl-sn-glycerol-3-phosphate acyltransferase|uniref:1-acyl-sn-glycerol-3-phosphate acyltransferase n=1 Tax=Oleiagrimonas sp. TaxID=2010330 RepID=UPI0026147AB7|nr:1-acyl-sn-glycerol-3-phosphate acyltransferase [Oleiagrimonas sp.]MDA3912824.1 1-acyl-sn-glycerol-3-phosphate acyltransferase [Oleiagrimonas sp.]
MKKLKQSVILLVYSIYGFYAVAVTIACLFVGGLIALAMPTLGLRRLVARWTLRILFFLSAMPYRRKGLGALPDQPCVVIANHRSYLDGLALIAALPPHFSAVIKHEMAEVPFIGWFLRRIGCRFVEREPAVRAGRDTLELLEALQAGESLAIFPEGTFSTDAGMLPFRDGAFYLAAKTDAPVVPVAIDGARKILPEGRFLPWPGSLSVRAFKAIPPDGGDRAAARRLREKAQAVLSDQLKPHPAARSRAKHDHAYYQDVFSGHALPLCYLDLDLLERNIRSILKRTGGKKLRVDARMLQCPGIIQRVMRSSPRFHGVKCSTVAEAIRLLDMDDMSDMLVTCPTVQSKALERVCAAIEAAHQITLTVDSPAHLEAISKIASRRDARVPLCVELDMSIARAGLEGPARRSPIRSNEALLRLVQRIDETPGVYFRGVLTHETQRNHFAEWMSSGGGGDKAALSKRNAARVQARRHEMVQALQAQGHEDFLVNCGGAGSMSFNASHAAVTEISVGAALFGLDPDDEQDIPAAGYAAEIIRKPGEDRYTCLVGGYTASRTAGTQSLPRPYLPDGAYLDELHGSAEAQLPIRCTERLDIGDMVFLHPVNTNEMCERFSRLQLVQNGAIVGEAETYRL